VGEASYLAVVEEALLQMGRESALLSALDVQTVLDWQARGVPLCVALKGLRQGAHVWERKHAYGEAFPSRLSYFSTWVDKLHKAWGDRVFSAPAAPAQPASAPEPRASPAETDALLEQAVEFNRALEAQLMQALPEEERASLLRTALAAARQALPAASQAALESRARVECRRLLKERYNAAFVDLRELTR
jgi:hypothetical protein